MMKIYPTNVNFTVECKPIKINQNGGKTMFCVELNEDIVSQLHSQFETINTQIGKEREEEEQRRMQQFAYRWQEFQQLQPRRRPFNFDKIEKPQV